MDEVGEVLGFLDSRADVAFVRGNHDNYLQALLPEGAALPETLEVGGVLIAHGHKETELVRRWKGPTISAHEHPSLKLRDGVGARVFAPAFVHDAESGTLVLPALSPLARGSDILWGRFLSPVLRRLDRDRLRVIAVAGSGLLDFGPAGRIFAPGGPSGPEGVGVHSQIRSAKYYIG